MHLLSAFRPPRWMVAASYWLAAAAVHADGTTDRLRDQPVRQLTNVANLWQRAGQRPGLAGALGLDAVLCTATPENGILVLQDDSGTAILRADWQHPAFPAGQRVHLAGMTGTLMQTEQVLSVGLGPVVDNDGVHGMLEQTGTVFLQAGRHPFRLDWFNSRSGYGLKIEYAGPGISRRSLASPALWHRAIDPATGRTNDLPGLDYHCYEGVWPRLPDLPRLTPVRSGTVSEFDLHVVTRPENVAVEFTGLIEVRRAGRYDFFVTSDDGSKLFIQEAPPQVTGIGLTTPPNPIPLAIGQMLTADELPRWSEVEGEVTFWTTATGQTALELNAGAGHMELGLAAGHWNPPPYLLHARLRATGVDLPVRTQAGSLVAGALWVADPKFIHPLALAAGTWANYGLRTINYLARTSSLGPEEEIVHVRGEIRAVTGERALVLEDETGQVPVETILPPPESATGQWEVLGRWHGVGTNVVLRDAIFRERPEAPGESGDALPRLTTAGQVRRLTREEARRAYPVQIRGVLAWVASNLASLIIQDSTRAIYLRHTGSWGDNLPQVGEYWEIQGVSDPADFAPIVNVSKAIRLGYGRLPDPLHPTWDQLINGSLDAQYVEIQGIISGTTSHSATLLTHGGKLTLTLPDLSQETLRSSENAIVRLRGCLFADWNAVTHQVRNARNIRLGNASLTVDEPAPANPFAAPKKSVGDLLLFDAQAGALQRVRVAGQVVHWANDACWMMDGTNGIRFLPRDPVHFDPGDLVEVVGFPDWGGASPVLREAVARKTGQALLPEPGRLLPVNSLRNSYDATRVRVEGRLFNVRDTRFEQVLEIQGAPGTFLARLRLGAQTAPPPVPGSWLELTGVYSGQGGNRLEGRELSSFELLLNSPGDIRVIDRPGWWTLSRLMAAVGVLLGILVVAFAWITQLRRQVEKRTTQLQAEVRERQRAEQLRAVEEERSRIARDLHDDLGSSLTEIGMLASSGPGLRFQPDQARERLGQIAGKSRSLVHALDEIVWAVNPLNDTLASLANYLASYVDEFLSPTSISRRIQIPHSLPDTLLPAEIRHDVFLAVKEALSNAVRHAGATEIVFRLHATPNHVELQIVDNGKGFDTVLRSPGNGLANLADRMRHLNGNCRIESRPGHGTTVTLRLPLSIPIPIALV